MLHNNLADGIDRSICGVAVSVFTVSVFPDFSQFLEIIFHALVSAALPDWLSREKSDVALLDPLGFPGSLPRLMFNL